MVLFRFPNIHIELVVNMVKAVINGHTCTIKLYFRR